MYNLSLTQEQAEVLVEILSRISGDPESTRGIADDIRENLNNLGVYSTLGTEDKYPSEGNITFR